PYFLLAALHRRLPVSVISLGGDWGRGPVYVRSTSHRVEILCTAVKDAKCHKETDAPQPKNSLFEHLVGAGQQRGRQIETEHLGGLEVDYELVLGWQLDRKVGGLCTIENPADVDAST